MSQATGNGHYGGWRSRKWLLQTALLVASAGLATAAISMVWPKTYRAEAKILPIVSSSSASSLLGLASGAGLGDLLSGTIGTGENPVLTYPEILKSRAMREHVAETPFARSGQPTVPIMVALGIQKQDRFGMERAVHILGDITQIEANPRSGVLAVSVVARDSVLAATIVTTMLAELDRFNMDTRSSHERATREFVEARLAETRSELSSAEVALTRFRESNVRMGNAPQLQLVQTRLEREVASRYEIVSLLARQFELARIEEKRDTPTFTVVDPAKPPVRKYRPKVIINTLVVSLGVLGIRLLSARMERQNFLKRLHRPEPAAGYEVGRELSVS
ncbi:MAG TPA: Wzz/FepE/Etk N-terminal domain-containing protein [Candidatus Eisenbacteria bacterium]|nr:Wzz/FepE/Etk N-terminal domain-containing protein [Candidatus Eisenbacteria bacterium]